MPVFEKGDADRGDRDHLVSWVRALGKPVLDSIRVDEESKSCPPLQAADLAAWEHRYTVAAVATGTLNKENLGEYEGAASTGVKLRRDQGGRACRASRAALHPRAIGLEFLDAEAARQLASSRFPQRDAVSVRTFCR